MWLLGYQVMTKDASEPGGGLPRNAITRLKPVEWLTCASLAAMHGSFRELGEAFWIDAIWLTMAIDVDEQLLQDPSLLEHLADFDVCLRFHLAPSHPLSLAPPEAPAP